MTKKSIGEELRLDDYFDETAEVEPLELWEKAARKTLKGRDPASLKKSSFAGVEVNPVYFSSSPQTVDARVGMWTRRQRYDVWSGSELRDVMHADLSRAVDSAWICCGGSGAHFRTHAEFGAVVGPWIEAGGREIVLEVNGDPTAAIALLEKVDVAGRVYIDPIARLVRSGESSSGLVDAVLRLNADSDVSVGLIDGRAYHVRGASAVVELGLMLASAAEMARCAPDREHRDVWLESVALMTGVDSEIFTGIAKLRALRWVWSKLLAGLKHSSSAHVHAVTSEVTLTRRDPFGNMYRASTQCFTAAAGGADAITVVPFDRQLGRPNALAMRVASQVHNVLAEEAHLDRPADPAYGSHSMESLTESIARQAWSTFQTIEAAGGVFDALESGMVAGLIDSDVESRRESHRRRRHTIVGVSDFADVSEKPDAREPVSAGENDEAHSGLRDWEPDLVCEPIERYRDADEFESIVARTQVEGIEMPKVFLANLGPPSEHSARSGFAKRYFDAIGLPYKDTEGFDSPDTILKAFEASDARAAAICGTDVRYEELAASLASKLESQAEVIVYFGNPGARREELGSAGVTHFAYLGFDAVATARSIFEGLEIP